MDTESESYLHLLLSDSNLPTGSFVASAGLESYVKHGFFSPADFTSTPSPPSLTRSTINFVRDSVQAYAHSALPFISAVYDICVVYRDQRDVDGSASLEQSLRSLKEIDDLYESMTLNHVAKRASTAQGVAHLTLLSKGFVRPSWLHDKGLLDGEKLGVQTQTGGAHMERLADELKIHIRRGDINGHLPICWGIMTVALGLSCERSQYLHMFLHARALVSASIRLNILGPYAAQQLLLHIIHPLLDNVVKSIKPNHLRLVGRASSFSSPSSTSVVSDSEVDDECEIGPAMTWPLGEILATRHDLQHSRIFNS
ncbi:uncharacterized protein EI90DRAFT_2990680 [Cantharellus anzutake]|uniref:uncharacterized protein n=1 Tax=Cantharellus anzutake TaxID=1750568 RepID=UPI0019079B78|nr:uncharacterized protein EI90DRAFT_2990680 [Cantharellus anzutake]KAF8338742.1 hypothetical protein EI90DRAFT_2990680 [Cantharellus anzutake]